MRWQSGIKRQGFKEKEFYESGSEFKNTLSGLLERERPEWVGKECGTWFLRSFSILFLTDTK